MAFSLIGLLGGCVALVYGISMRATPRRGLLRVAERICLGMILCYLCHVALSPFGLHIAQGPLSALSAGYLGLPGVALATVFSMWP